jgi:hypothetical protein
MDALNTWDLALFAAAGYIAVSSLVRLMINKRNALATELRSEMEQEKRRREQIELEKQQQKQLSAKLPAAKQPARDGRPAA